MVVRAEPVAGEASLDTNTCEPQPVAGEVSE
jgi:hypothetical protein